MNAGAPPRNVGNLNDLGAVPGMPSVPSLRQMIAARPDFPMIERGAYGKAFKFDLDDAAAFVRLHWRDGRLIRTRANDPRQPSLLDQLGVDA